MLDWRWDTGAAAESATVRGPLLFCGAGLVRQAASVSRRGDGYAPVASDIGTGIQVRKNDPRHLWAPLRRTVPEPRLQHRPANCGAACIESRGGIENASCLVRFIPRTVPNRKDNATGAARGSEVRAI